jgi:hypothetical protein
LALSVALVSSALGSAHGRRLLSDPEGAAADLCSLATAAAGSGSSPPGEAEGEARKLKSGDGGGEEEEEEGIVCSTARLGVLQLATCSAPSSPLLRSESIGKLLGPPLSLAAAAEAARQEREGGRAGAPSAASLSFSVRALCLLCRTPAGVDALLRGGGGEEGGIPWPRAATPTSTAAADADAAVVRLLLSQRGEPKQGPLAALERALRGDPLARLHLARGGGRCPPPAAEEVAVALASRGAPAALPALAAAGAGDPFSLARAVVDEAAAEKQKRREGGDGGKGVPSHVAAAAAAVALAEAAEAAASFGAALLVRGGGEGIEEEQGQGQGGGEGGGNARQAPFRLPESAVAAALAVAAAAAATAANAAEGPILPPWCAREMPAIEALLAPSSSSSSSSSSSGTPRPSIRGKDTAELESSSSTVALTAVSR